MAVINRKDIMKDVDSPTRSIDAQKTLLDNIVTEKTNVKKTPLSRLHGIKTEVTYYEQVVSARRDNLANNASINAFDPNIMKFRKITNFVILTDGLDLQIDKDVFTNLSFEGTAKILPNTVVPNANDFFIMKVYDVYHLFKVTEVNPALIEKDTGFEIRFKIYRAEIVPENCELEVNVKEKYSFDYNHVGTDFRTILKTDESDFIANAREIMYYLIKVYGSDIFYHRTFNTIMSDYRRYPSNISSIIETMFEGTKKLPMIGTILSEGVSLYDISLVHFLNKFNIFSSHEYVHVLTEYSRVDRRFYNGSIFSVIESMDINKFKNDKQLLVYSTSNLFFNTNRLYGRIFVDHVTGCNPQGQVCLYGDWVTDPARTYLELSDNFFTLDLFPTGFVSAIRNYESNIMYAKTEASYTSLLSVLIDMISTFINETDTLKKRAIIIKLVNTIKDKFINYINEDEFDNVSDILYIYPLSIYVLKYMTREISTIEFK